MRYINKDDLATIMQMRFLLESVENSDETLSYIEDMVISEVSAYIGSIYDVNQVFGNPPLRTGLLVRIISNMVCYRAIMRNSARKVPDSIIDLSTWADNMLIKIRDGIMTLPNNIPKNKGEDGKDIEILRYGHNRNSNWFV